MKTVALAVLGVLALTAGASAAQTATAGRTINAATQLPDTTYSVVVNQVQDATHIFVTFSNGERAVLTAGRPNMTFASIHAGDTVMLSTSKGTVLVFKDFGPRSASPPAPASTP